MPLSYKVLSTQNSFDAITTIMVPIDDFVEIMKTSDIDLNNDFAVNPGSIIYEESQVIQPKGGQIAVFEESGEKKYTTNGTQNIFDIALMTVGDINKIVEVLQNNGYYFTSMNAVVDGVFSVNYNESDITDNGFKLAVLRSKINFTTGDMVGIGHSYDFGFNYSFDS